MTLHFLEHQSKKISLMPKLEAYTMKQKMEAKDGKEAISLYIAHKPHVVVMDIVMPNVDGIKATKAIMQYDPKAKIIVISAKENKEIVNEVVNKYGAKDYVLKPIDSSSIVMAVSKQLIQNRSKKIISR